MKRIIPRPNTSTALALCALFAALGGTAFAAKHYIITSTHQIKPSVLAALHGQRGPRGQVGPAGLAGREGPAGHEGSAGQEGSKGLTGERGLPGGLGPRGNPGEHGEPGPQGPPGVQGSQGMQGIQGPQGEMIWMGTWEATAVYAKGEAVDYEGSSYISLGDGNKAHIPSESVGEWWDLVAKEGRQGTQGPQGEKGDKGETGPSGEQGQSGEPATRLWAVVDKEGKLVHDSEATATSILENAEKRKIGLEVTFDRTVSGCVYEASIEGSKEASKPVVGFASVAPGASDHGVDVFTSNIKTESELEAFHLAVFC